MKRFLKFGLRFLIGSICANAVFAQEPRQMPDAPKTSGDYVTDVGTVAEAQNDALTQAKELLDQTENAATHSALETAIKEMERSRDALEKAKTSPDKLPAAVSAEEAAYQALLKTIPREYRVQRSRNGQQSGGGSRAGTPNSQELQQLEMANDEERYQSERQAQAAPNAQQREQLQIASRLRELAQRQQDLNSRLKELQTALAEAKTDQEREEIQRQLKRLGDEEKQMLANVDELKQQMDQSPNANSMEQARQQLEQTRSDTERASQALDNQSASQALASGTRVQQNLEKLRDDMRSQTSSRFSEQMRQMRNQARQISQQEDDIGKGLASLNDPDHKTLDDTAQRKALTDQLAKQESALTNLLDNMQNVTEQAETTEPLLSQQLYDTLRRADQLHTDNLLETSQQLVDHDLIDQASMAEHTIRTNVDEIRQRVERAADSVLGNESDALKYAQKELDDLAGKLEREVNGTNASGAASDARGTNETERLSQTARAGAGGRTNNVARAGDGNRGTNNVSRSGEGNQNGEEAQNGQGGAQGEANAGRNGEGNQGQRQAGQNGRQGGQNQANAGGQSGQQSGQQQANGGRNGRGNNSENQQANNNNGQEQQNGQGQGQGEGQQQAEAGGGGNGGNTDLSRVAQQFGENNGAERTTDNTGARNNGGAGGLGYGPITGNDFVDWSGRMRDVEEVLDAPDMRNRLATARERLAGFRAEYRRTGKAPNPDDVRNQVLAPITEVRTQLQEDLARLQNANSLVPLDHDPVPDTYSELVRKYYEKLGGGQ